MKDKVWNLVTFGFLEDWLERSLGLPSYIPFTNSKYLEVERKDSLFWTNTKDYFTVYVPLIIVLFIILNRLFRLLSRCAISIFLRVFSFKLYLLEMLFINNIQILFFLALRNFSSLFSLTAGMKWIQAMLIIFNGVAFITFISLFFFYRFQYEWLSKYFLGNLYRVDGALPLIFFRIVIKPLCLSAVHS